MMPSRTTHEPAPAILVCGDCVSEEALRDQYGLAPVPPTEWPVTTTVWWASLAL